MADRLNDTIREGICEAALAHRFDADFAKLERDKSRLAEATYAAIYDSGTRRRMNSLPKGWLPEATELSVRFEGNSKGDRTVLDLPQARRFLDKHESAGAWSRTVSHVFGAREPVSIEAQRIVTAEAALKEERNKARRAVMTALHQARTIKQLVEAWPEIAPFAAQFGTAMLPAVDTRELNRRLGLDAGTARATRATRAKKAKAA